MWDLTIIIVNYNTKKLTLECLESITGEKSKLKVEIVVIDNSSKDGSVKVLREFKNTSTGSQFRLIENKNNLGFSKAVNQGMKKAKGKHVLLLNSDTKVQKGTFAKLIKFANNTGDAGVIGSRLLNSNGTVQPSCYRFPTIIKAIKQYWFNQKGILDKYVPKGRKAVAVDAVVGGAFLITPNARRQVGLLDERYFMYFEDIDYCRRVWRAGMKVYYLPAAEIVHYHGESGKELADEANQWRRGIPSSKIYHGAVGHYIINSIIWTSQKLTRIFNKNI